jgi:formate--tetrahydrofolate ligase
VVVAINRFPSDTQGELEVIATECRRLSVPCSFVEAFAKGGLGAVGLAEKVACLVEENHLPGVRSIYSLEETPEEKINKIATLVYGASGVELSELAQEKLARFAEWGFGRLPVCIAKTQYSLTDDPHRLGAPTGWTLKVRDVQLSAGGRQHDADAGVAQGATCTGHRRGCRRQHHRGVKQTGNREQGTGNREQGTGNREQLRA